MQASAATKWKIYLIATRPQFLLLIVVLVILGASVAHHESAFDLVGRCSH